MIVRARHSVCSLLISSLSTQATRVARALQASHPECGAAGVSVRTARPRIMCVRCSEFHRLSLLHFCRPGTRRGESQKHGCTYILTASRIEALCKAARHTTTINHAVAIVDEICKNHHNKELGRKKTGAHTMWR